MKQKCYQNPRVLAVAEVGLGDDVLFGPSLIDHLSFVETMGQDLEQYDFTENPFNHEWGE